MNKVLGFDGLLMENGWLEPAYVNLQEDGVIEEISQAPPPLGAHEWCGGYAIPGFPNAHSHAFQYAMAGLTEHLPVDALSDDFWSWRETMYQLALSLSPEQMQAIATMLYAEMLRNGITSVAEFHYLHHDPKGHPYADKAEMGRRLLQAAQDAGIRITLLPIFYQQGGFQTPPNPRQRRFLSQTSESYHDLLEQTTQAARSFPQARVGIGLHSMRAVKVEDLKALYHSSPPDLPRHIHVAEQQAEIDACLHTLKRRPVQWLLEHVEIGPRDHLVHATHLISEEIEQLARSRAHVVLCPSTEGNLGDGLFPLREYMHHGGQWSIGTDSHIGLNPHEELRLLDYGQRLHHQKRNIFCLKGGDDSGVIAFTQLQRSGRAAMGAPPCTFFQAGTSFDAAVYNTTHPLFALCPPERRLSTILYACDVTALQGVLVDGQWKINDGRHQKADTIHKHFVQALSEIRQHTRLPFSPNFNKPSPDQTTRKVK